MKEGGNYRFIITGGPGSGKTSLVNALAKSGYKTFPEIARKLMQDGIEAPVNTENLQDGNFFAREILRNRIRQHKEGEGRGIQFYDRGLPDSLGFLNYLGIEPSDSLLRIISSHPYNGNVFFLSPWKDIYHQDEIRKESFDTACDISECIRSAYLESDYKLIDVPRGKLSDRLGFILDQLQDFGLLGNKPVG